MNLELPRAIERYFQAGNDRNEAAFLDCFTTDAIVADEKETHSGRDAIAAWFNRTRDEYDFQSEPKSSRQEGDSMVVVSAVSGNFPGSPVDLNYKFEIDGDRISNLEIV